MRKAALFFFFSAAAMAAADFQFSVVRVRPLWPDEPGQLEVGAAGVSYQSANGKTKLHVAMEDIRDADVSDPKTIRIETYDRLRRKLGERREYTFRLLEGTHGEDLAQFLGERIARPVEGSYTTVPAAFTIPAYHRHALRGVSGALEIGPQAIRFVAVQPADSRTWLYRDIESVGNSDPFHLRVSTGAETYMFDLKERLKPEAYDFAWQRVFEASRLR
jgi:hypothetical protein